MSDASILTQTDLKQRRASDPKASSFVAANAGSGKTYVLVRRILRLLVEGVDPSRILALTYTTAAAANMANRVFLELSKWVRLDDEALAREVQSLDGNKPDAARLKLARQIFARAIETPGGLKIQTIHAFCERVLHLFPFEANVPAGFEVLDEDGARSLLELARNRIIRLDGISDDPDLADALRRVIDDTGESKFDDIIKIVLRHQYRIRSEMPDTSAIKLMMKRLADILGVDADETSVSFQTKIYQHRIDDRDCKIIAEYLAQSDKPTDIKTGKALFASIGHADNSEWRDFYCKIFLTKEGKAKADKTIATQFISDKRPDLFAILQKERERLAFLNDRQLSVTALERTHALMLVARAIIQSYENEKARMGVLDFGDLVERTRTLLKRASAQWVLYKLDKGIDHLLIDEAQDTSPEQWDVLEKLTDEFFSGEGARSLTRTVFAVGDPKQSIYSFQGADPKKFSEYRDRFERRITQLSEDGIRQANTFYREDLTLSFRSVPDVLDAVDAIFSLPQHYEGLDRDPEPTRHQSVRMNAPGLVELWPVIRKDKIEISENWLKPVDRPDDSAPSVDLARRIAAHIARLVDPASPELIEEKPGQFRPIVPGDILILVRKRSIFFETVIRALKDLGLPVAGADRLKLASHIAVMDLVALGEAILTPEDDLTLATVLKSPLIGLNDDDLVTLCYGRSGSLIASLSAVQKPAHLVAARDKFFSYRDAAYRSGPYGFYAFVLGPCGGRSRLRARLGAEAEDAIDEFLRLALDHDHHETASLQRFLAGFKSAEREVKRDMESGRNEIRVMTVHGAKGLEAPIVYLPDTCGAAKGKGIDPVFDLEEDRLTLLWTRRKEDDSLVMSSLREEMTERVRREHRRLLYVALTRARDRLYIAGYSGDDKLPDDCWYTMIEAGLSSHLQAIKLESGEMIRRLQRVAYPDISQSKVQQSDLGAVDLPVWLFRPVDDERPPLPPLRPSNAIDAADRSDRPVDLEFARLARRRGTLVHALLEVLPDLAEERREALATAWLKARAIDLDAAERTRILNDALALVRAPHLQDLFGASSRAEVPIAGLLHRSGKPPRKISGQVDRLAVLSNEIIIADYKTAAHTPQSVSDIPESYIAQLAAYRALIPALYPDRTVRCMLIYTSGPTVFEIDAARLDMSLAQIA